MEKKIVGFRFLILFIVLSLFVQVGCFAMANTEAKKGEILFSQLTDLPAYDFGQVPEGDVVKHTFVVKNDGENTVNITGINTSCGCAAGKASKDSLASGESADIEVKFNSKGYKGIVNQFVYINTDDPQNPIIKLTIKAEVVKGVSPKGTVSEKDK